MRTALTRTLLSTILVSTTAFVAPGSAAGLTVTATVPNGIATTDVSAGSAAVQALATSLASVGSGIAIDTASVAKVGTAQQLGTVSVLDPSVVSFNNGVILSSGDVANIVGPNKSDGITGVGLGNADADLTALIADTQTVNPMTYDAASLSFDFTPTQSTAYFTYVFGSDEYLEWVNLFNDVFGFFITDATGHTTNCAMTPSGHTISIDTINDNVNAGLYRDNSFASPPVNPLNIEADGLSVELICQASVTPNQKNHMKIAIADTSDQILDSWVMIKAGSLSVKPPESCNNNEDDDKDGQVDLYGGMFGELPDDDCTASTTPAPQGASGIGVASTPPAFTGSAGAGNSVLLDGSIFDVDLAALDTAVPPDPSEAPNFVEWTLTAINGNTGTCTIEPSGPMPVLDLSVVPTAVASCTKPGEYRATLNALYGTDSKGDWDIDFFVQDAPPTVTLTSPTLKSTYDKEQTVSVAASVEGLTDGETATCTIDWGKGSGPVAGTLMDGQCTGTTTYSVDGQYLVSVAVAETATVADPKAMKAATASIIYVGKQPQTITVTTAAPASAEVGTSFAVVATGGASGNPVVPTAAGSCTYDADTEEFTITSGEGLCEITLSQAGDSTYFSTSVVSYTTATKIAQSVTVTTAPPASAVYASSFTLIATAGASTLAPIFNSDGVCTNVDAKFTMTAGAGDCTVTVTQPGTTSYASATAVYTVAAAYSPASPVAVKSSVRRGSSFLVSKVTKQGVLTAVTVAPKAVCSVSKVYSRGKFVAYKVKGLAKGRCTVKVTAKAKGWYLKLTEIKYSQVK